MVLRCRHVGSVSKLTIARLSQTETSTMGASPKERYKGKEKLLISIDLGTTVSPYTPRSRLPIRASADLFVGAVAYYTHLFPGSIPQVR